MEKSSPHNKAVIGTFFAARLLGVAPPLYTQKAPHKKCPIQRRYAQKRAERLSLQKGFRRSFKKDFRLHIFTKHSSLV